MYSLHGEGGSHPSIIGLRREEPSIKEEWMDKISDVRIPRLAMNKLIMKFLSAQSVSIQSLEKEFAMINAIVKRL